jgi:hypothetical protein
MQWPSKPSCHGERSSVFVAHDMSWWPPQPKREPSGVPFRTCSFCGSICPEDFIELCGKYEIGMDLADMKYGYPHKYYVEGIPNPLAGQIVKIGSETEFEGDQRIVKPIMGPAPEFAFAKFYTEHFLDVGYDEEALQVLIDTVARLGGISFSVDDGKLRYARNPRATRPPEM